jgi:hypothetical protein
VGILEELSDTNPEFVAGRSGSSINISREYSTTPSIDERDAIVKLKKIGMCT